MPFYLVTQVTLIEADDPKLAAQSAVDLLRSGAEVSVTVKHDQADVSHVTVPARIEAKAANTVKTTKLDEPPATVTPPIETTTKPGRPITLMRRLADKLTIWRR